MNSAPRISAPRASEPTNAGPAQPMGMDAKMPITAATCNARWFSGCCRKTPRYDFGLLKRIPAYLANGAQMRPIPSRSCADKMGIGEERLREVVLGTTAGLDLTAALMNSPAFRLALA